ncbi:MAG: 2-oxoacid:acceptor oxidoreductase family protein [Gammaproteobacteria bacterium]|uniref:2-oxoacid:acceptor oxidoreductase family protein n=1 Tax=Rhodoferax sp. TaxID=50421 RepID=UPI00180F24B4|nr:2-oxoacid:acceptor oxidoreductase family protein [Rhodoferax sp.]MBU3898793.1 2-oxoacid:acceptor oxidoreductase family protein [Gammaproteobacteria bacterium]MBA3057353.1 pyruvate-flavodoxin oxidoreductase [Rhodoferax sp.]MBU3998984.1 2-oxoacid:acceptor oxidoreductase family protein [Gammaproteobacteria bacterium]MBU4019269.1 2-oxoacid:acceptor oxidoreductase family protein [Gammaproteobacteria bacterium]MBU4081833.1 2-oxoacid:acceptor oxidoreductase family protein [Gammaproteobacteria bact
MNTNKAKYPGIPNVIHGNGAVAYVMNHVCSGVIGYPITPSTEIAEIYEAFRAEGGINVWGKHPFFFGPEGEHSAQSGALGAALTGGQFISNASSSQGILYALESHYVTVGKKVGGFVLQVAARVVSKHSLNVMAGHDDVYALMSSGYTILFGANPQEAADLAAISYRVASLSLIPVANAMDGFATSHMLCEALMPEPELLAEYLGDPAGRIKAPTLAQEMLYGARGRVAQLQQYLARRQADLTPENLAKLQVYLDTNAAEVEQDNAGQLVARTLGWLPEELHGQWQRQWVNAFEKGTRQLVPALVDVNNPGLTGAVQNQADFQAGAVDHRTHFVNAVPGIVRQAMDEYSALTGRQYAPVQTFMCDDADTVMVGLGSVTDDVEAVVSHLRGLGQKVGLIAIKMLQPFPEGELVAALQGKKAVTVLERSDQTALTGLVTQALFKAHENAVQLRHPGIPALSASPLLTTAIFGLGGHDLQPRHLIAAFKSMQDGKVAPLIYLGSQFFSQTATPRVAELQARLKLAYPETELMALETEANPKLLPDAGFRVRFHSVGGYGTIASGKLLTDILAGVLEMHSKSAPKYGSEKSGAPTNYYITLSPEPVKITNAELEDVEVVIAPDHKVFSHTNALLGLVAGGTFILQSNATAEEVWQELPAQARKTIRARSINFFIVDAFAVAKKHAPTPELATRMMGIAFIGAVAGHVSQVSNGAAPEVILEKVRQQIAKKFGGKGGAVMEGNMAVIREGIEATQKVDYALDAFARIDARPAPIAIHDASLSASMCQSAGSSSCAGMFDREYYDDMVLNPFREGTIGEAPVLPGTGLFMPAGSAGAKDKGLFRRSVPEFKADLCTGCMECALVCPDGAIPNSVHDIHELLLTGIGQLELPPAQHEVMRGHVYALTEGVREAYRQSKQARPFHELVAEAATSLETDNVTVLRNFSKLIEALALYPVARTRPFFDAMEKAKPGSGALYGVSVDPWKCTGCLECVEVCGPGALVTREQDAALLQTLQQRFDFLSKTPNTPARFVADAIKPGGEIKRLLLDRANYYSTTGGHGACRGCGEVTATRLVMATSHALADRRQRAHSHELERLIDGMKDKQATLADDGAERHLRLGALISTLEKRLYLYESGPTGNGPAGTVVANSTGCSSVYASTFPFNAFKDPWVNSLFQDAQPLAKGIFEGIAAQTVGDVRALRLARLELADAYDAPTHDPALRMLSWEQFSAAELGLMPTVITIGGDGATYDIGFGALSRILMSGTPLKVLVLNTGSYSNTGGQASTSSFLGQDSDLARFGSNATGKHESRKELGLIAAFHSNVFVCATSTALQGHFLKNTMEALSYTDGPALLDVYTPCQGEQGIGDGAASERSRLAVESRMSPVFVHDPRRGSTLHDWFSLEGNPDPLQTWAATTLEYQDDEGQLKLMSMALTPAHFALGEVRFKKQFHKLGADEASAVPVEAYIELSKADRAGKTAFIWSTDANKRLVKIEVVQAIVALVEERRKYWHLLQFLDGQHVAKMDESHRLGMAALQAQYLDSVTQRDSSLDSFARAMSELAAASKAPVGSARVIPIMAQSASAGSASASPAVGATTEALVTYDIADQVKCTDCKTCYQDLPELFEKTRIVVHGESRDVGQLIVGAMERIKVTPELQIRIKRVAANCDAEIIS